MKKLLIPIEIKSKKILGKARKNGAGFMTSRTIIK